MTAWAIDLGTSNTGLAYWDATAERPRLLELPRICRSPGGDDPLEAPRLVPTATHVLPEGGAFTRFLQRPFLDHRIGIGERALIGRRALEQNQARAGPAFTPGFKSQLALEPLRTLVRQDHREYSAREVARLFVRELLAEARRVHGERIRALTVTTPVHVYETFRAELAAVFHAVGVRELRFLDEPVAAAIGYGLALGEERRVLLVDCGGGTLHTALVVLSARDAREGSCRVEAKQGHPVGGDVVDRWLLEAFCERLGFELHEDAPEWDRALWYRFMLAEARRVKEAVHFAPSARFDLTPPEDLRSFRARLGGEAKPLEVTRDDVAEVLRAHGFYRLLEGSVDGALAGASPDEVLLVGGSTLLPGVYALLEQRFGRDRVRAWQPFEAVAYGACAYAAGRFTQLDYVLHDYAIVTHDAHTNAREHTVIVPRGTRIPTAPDFWRRQLVPTCALGEPETFFKLLVCEIGRADAHGRTFAYDAQGGVKKLGGHGGEDSLVVMLNETNPTLGELRPPHPPSDRAPRLDVSFGVNADRWLCTSVVDLRSKKVLLRERPVVRLL